MRRLRMEWWFVLAMNLIALDARAAEDTDVPLRVQFAPESACIDDAALARELRGRGLHVAGPEETPRYDVKVQARPTGGGFEATMVLMAAGEAPAVRVIFAATCDEVWSTYGLTLALALSQLPDGPAVVLDRKPNRPPPPPPPPPPAKRLVFSISGSSRMMIGSAPDPAPAFGLAAELEMRRERGIFSPRARLGAFAMLPPSFSDGSVPVSGRFALQAVELDVCPVRFFSRVVVRPCAKAEIGRLQAAAFGVPEASLESALWAAVKFGISARWEPVRPIFIDVEAAAGPALSRAAFLVRNGSVFEVPSVVGHAGIFAGAHFP